MGICMEAGRTVARILRVVKTSPPSHVVGIGLAAVGEAMSDATKAATVAAVSAAAKAAVVAEGIAEAYRKQKIAYEIVDQISKESELSGNPIPKEALSQITQNAEAALDWDKTLGRGCPKCGKDAVAITADIPQNWVYCPECGKVSQA